MGIGAQIPGWDKRTITPQTRRNLGAVPGQNGCKIGHPGNRPLHGRIDREGAFGIQQRGFAMGLPLGPQPVGQIGTPGSQKGAAHAEVVPFQKRPVGCGLDLFAHLLHPIPFRQTALPGPDQIESQMVVSGQQQLTQQLLVDGLRQHPLSGLLHHPTQQDQHLLLRHGITSTLKRSELNLNQLCGAKFRIIKGRETGASGYVLKNTLSSNQHPGG